jgi:hypothetical protein
LLIISISLASCAKQNIRIPDAGKVANEYLVQNTVKYALKNNLYQSDIDKNPSKYHIINGLSAEESKTAAPTLYTNDTAPYYDPTKPQAAPKKTIPNQQVALNRYTNQIYQNDKVPYYSPTSPYRTYKTGGEGLVRTKIIMGNLEERNASQANIDELKKQYAKLEQNDAPKYLTHDAKGREAYFKDSAAYYDPTRMDKEIRKKTLRSNIINLTKELNSAANAVPLVVGVKKMTIHSQNFINNNREETNEFIAKSYHYDVDRSTLVNRKPEQTIVNLKPAAVQNKDNTINIYTRKPERILMGSTNKYYDDKKSVTVEAESTGVKADARFYTQ